MLALRLRLFLVYLTTQCLLAEDFNIWDYCNQTATKCELPLGSARFAVGSGYEKGSDKWYLIGGQITNSFFYTATVAVINIPSTSNDLTEFSNCSYLYPNNLPQGITQSASAVIDDELYSFGGFTELNNKYYYINTTFNSDTTTQSTFGSTLKEMPAPRSATCSLTVGTKVYVIGGLLNGSITNNALVYDSIDDSWKILANLSVPRFAPGCSYNNGKIYIFGGQTVNTTTNDGFGVDLNTTEIYDIKSDTWSESLIVLSYNAHWINCAYLNILGRNLTLIMGGSSGYPVTVYDNLDVYDMDKDEIVGRQHLREGRYAFESVTLSHGDWNNKFILIAGGKNTDGEADRRLDAIYCKDRDMEETTTDSPMATTEVTVMPESYGVIPGCYGIFIHFVVCFVMMIMS